MKPDPRNRELLDRVFGDAELDTLRKSLRRRCLGELAARRPRRRTGVHLLVAAASLLVTTALVHLLWQGGAPSPAPRPPGYRVSTAPLAAGVLVRSQPLSPGHTARVPPPRLVRVRTAATTTRVIGDRELLSHFTGIPCALVGRSPRKLVFLQEEDRKRYLGETVEISATSAADPGDGLEDGR